ncbi:hypothetical protein Halha_1696 [Halobacteroides halobius DSM 5150]|uniref:Uncharacterized protein n=1 Tax=Halobacteroides halobius (strain ATCC 35273 / DSM 5150 / MD-1) TaxID=748449 RepID=L0KC17_HALHC|nr:hypothetical protein [Halobacteroides halobius]AGB41633.1 hypothetical protein Halha_1696 [Halobacteroides halobius DSM 5150]
MENTKEAIERLKENPFRSLDDLAAEANLDKEELLSALEEQDLELATLRRVSTEHMFDELSESVGFNYNNLIDVDCDDK